MSDPNAVAVPHNGESSWDDFFPPDAQPAAGSQQTDNGSKGDQPSSAPAAAQPAAPAPSSIPAAFELRTKTGTVYKSLEETAKGIEHKDALIEQFIQREILRTGVHPITGQPVQLTSVQQPQSYMQDPKRYYQDLVSAAQKSDPDAVWKTQTQLIFDALAPYAPVMANLAKQQAIDTLSAEIKDFREFYNGEDYKKALAETPDLKDAIERAEVDNAHHQRLPGLYKVAYRVSQGLRLPEILKAQPQAAPAAQVRGTTAPATLTPAQPGVQPALYGNKAGRQALIAQMEASGVADSILS